MGAGYHDERWNAEQMRQTFFRDTPMKDGCPLLVARCGATDAHRMADPFGVIDEGMEDFREGFQSTAIQVEDNHGRESDEITYPLRTETGGILPASRRPLFCALLHVKLADLK